jgi:hypothetical protein
VPVASKRRKPEAQLMPAGGVSKKPGSAQSAAHSFRTELTRVSRRLHPDPGDVRQLHRQLESDVVWGIITANPAMADGNALFHTTHKNLAGTGTALASTRGRGAGGDGAADRLRQEDRAERPPRLPDRARLAGTEGRAAGGAEPRARRQTPSVVPQSIRTLSPISEPRLDAASETAWYLAASPNQIDTIEYAYLEGQQGAYIETRNGFDVDGVEIKCRLDFGAKAIDWRGLYKNPGA